jgi:hypothetical protein
VLRRWLGGLGSVDAVAALSAGVTTGGDPSPASSPLNRLVTFDWAWVTAGWSARLRAPSTICW